MFAEEDKRDEEEFAGHGDPEHEEGYDGDDDLDLGPGSKEDDEEYE